MIGSTVRRVSEVRREGVWPRVYRMRRGQRWLFGGLGVVLVGGALAGSGAILLASSESPALALLTLPFVVLGGYLLAAVKAERLLLHEDGIELLELGRRARRVRRHEVTGLRIVPLQYGMKALTFQLRGTQKPVKITWVYESDDVLDAWLGDIPDLDAEERARAEDELLRSTALGADLVERARSLVRARRIARVVNGAGLLAAAWGWLHPRPYRAAVVTLATLPLVALALLLAGRGRYAFDERRTDPRPSLIAAMLFPGLVLALRAIRDVHVIDWKPLAVGAAAGTLLLVALVAVGDPPRKRRSLVLVALLLAAYPWGALSLANALLDRAEPEAFRVEVRGKHVSHGKQTSYGLVLAPWGPETDEESVDVSRRLHDAVSVGDRVCTLLYPGALRVRWYVVLRCPQPRP